MQRQEKFQSKQIRCARTSFFSTAVRDLTDPTKKEGLDKDKRANCGRPKQYFNNYNLKNRQSRETEKEINKSKITGNKNLNGYNNFATNPPSQPKYSP